MLKQFRFFNHEIGNTKTVVILHICFCFSACNKYNVKNIAIGMSVVETFLSNLFLVIFAFLITKIIMRGE